MADLARLFNFNSETGLPIHGSEIDSELNQIIARLNDVDADSLIAALATQLGISQAGNPRRGKFAQAAAGTTSATAYSALTNGPDVVSGIVLPTDGLIVVGYQAIWQNTVGSNARAAIFVGGNQLKIGTATGAPAVQEANGPSETNDDGLLGTTGTGLAFASGAGAATEVTTGQVVGVSPAGVTYIFAAAGTYDISVQFKNAVAGTVTVKNRHLWAWTLGF